MSIPRTTGWGIGLAAATACISGVSIFVNGLVVKEFSDPVALTGARNALVGLVLLGILVASGGMQEVRTLRRRQTAGLAALAVLGGSVPFILFFSGLAEATGPGAALIHKTLFIWVAALAIVFLGESLGIAQVVALVALLAGVLLIGPTGAVGAGPAEVMVLAATLLWSVEVIVARRLLGGEGVSVRLAATSRMALGAVVIAAFLVASGRIGAVAAFSIQQWAIVTATGVLLLGYVTTWYAALQRAPASLVTAVLVGGAVVTGALATIRTGTIPAPPVEAGLGLLALGIGTVVWSAIRRSRTSPAADPSTRVTA
jgi:drug/metabolite transporter (DMT)-like permease